MSDFSIKSRIWVEHQGEVFLGIGRVKLLKAIDENGSISQAAKANKMSYKKAWTLIDSVNRASSEAVVVMNVGGKRGGGAELTEYGRKVIKLFEEINSNCHKYLDEQLSKFSQL